MMAVGRRGIQFGCSGWILVEVNDPNPGTGTGQVLQRIEFVKYI